MAGDSDGNGRTDDELAASYSWKNEEQQDEYKSCADSSEIATRQQFMCAA